MLNILLGLGIIELILFFILNFNVLFVGRIIYQVIVLLGRISPVLPITLALILVAIVIIIFIRRKKNGQETTPKNDTPENR